MSKPLFAILLALGMAQSAASQTVSDRVRAAKQTGKPVVTGTLYGVRALSIEELSALSDLILEATLTYIRTYIDPTDTMVMTDFAIVPVRALQGTVSGVTNRPGVTNPLILATVGGEVVIDGVTVRGQDHNLQPLQNGGRYLLFLRKFGTERGVYSVFNAAAFELTGDSMRMLAGNSGDAYKDFVDTPYSQVAARVIEAARKK